MHIYPHEFNNNLMKILNKTEKDSLCVSYLVLAIAIFICTGFALWLYQDTDMEKYIDYTREYRRLHLYDRFEDASKYNSDVLAGLTGDELDEIWLSTVQGERDPNLKLESYLRLLKGNPEREASYKEIADLINSLIDKDQINEREQYIKRLKAIPNIQKNLLEKYGLLSIDNS